MRDLLVPIFGDWGAVVAQYLLTIVIVLGLIGAVWWFMRRYSGVRFGGIGRGRVPRLAIVDAMTIDRRRRLVLVRRDNVEHLLLIGGPSDLVVEGTIQRVRQRSVQQAAQAAVARATLPPATETQAEPEAPQPEPAGAGERLANAPIPFPLSRSAHLQAASGNGRSQPGSARQRPARLPEAAITQEPAAAPLPQEAERHPLAEPPTETLLPEVMTAEAEPLPPAAPAPATFAEAEWEAAEEARQSALDLGDVDVPATASGEEEMAAATATGEDGTVPAESTASVGDLEREMARLLDEITTRRSS